MNDAEIQEDRWHRRPKQAAQPEGNVTDSVPESKAEEDRWHRRPKQAAQPEGNVISLSDSVPESKAEEDRWHRRPKQAAQPEINDDSVYAAQPEENVVSLSDSVPESKAEEDRWHRRPKQKTPIDVSDNVVYASEKNDTQQKEKDLTEGHATTVTYHYLGNETFVVLAGKFTRTLRGEYEALRKIRREAAQKLLEQKKLEEAAAAAKAEQIKKNTPKKFPKPPKNTAPEPAPLTDRAKPHSGSSEIGQDIKDEKLNTLWRFHLGDAPDADFMGYDDGAWRRVTLPHDWAVEHPFDTEMQRKKRLKSVPQSIKPQKQRRKSKKYVSASFLQMRKNLTPMT